jgi:hypothetical protein
MRPIFTVLLGLGLLFGMAVGSPLASAALLVNYQFESVVGTAPTQTTPDSSGTFTSSDVVPFVNALLGYGTNTPGTDYPQQLAGPVANATVKSVNPNNYMQFYGGLNANVTRVQIDKDAAGPLDVAFTNFSVALWLKATDTTTSRFAIGKMGNNGQRGWQITSPAGTTDLNIDYFSTLSNGSDRSFSFTNALPLDTWTHFVFTFDGTTGTEAAYINGVAQTLTNLSTVPTVPAVLNAANTAPFRVGHRGGNQSSVGGWVGGIDDARVYDQTLTAAEVQALLAPVTQPHAGDFDLDGDVDGADFVAWQTNFPTASGATRAQGDADSDGDVDGADFVVWQTNFPFTPGPGAAPVPEPHTILLVGIGSVLALASRRKLAG